MDQTRAACEVRTDDTFSRRVLDRCCAILQTLDLAAGELRELSDRNHGPSPEAANGAADGKFGPTCGRHGEVEQLLEILAMRADQVRGQARVANSTH